MHTFIKLSKYSFDDLLLCNVAKGDAIYLVVHLKLVSPIIFFDPISYELFIILQLENEHSAYFDHIHFALDPTLHPLLKKLSGLILDQCLIGDGKIWELTIKLLQVNFVPCVWVNVRKFKQIHNFLVWYLLNLSNVGHKQ